MAPFLLRLYKQMPKPKYVIAMEACTITGDPSLRLETSKHEILTRVHDVTRA
jgi:NADH:ubiquinone oxidoreductase subunit B-like Fe-S oxidoreductase